MTKKVSPDMQAVLDKMKEHGGEIIRRPGGYWTFEDMPEITRWGNTSYEWYAKTLTIRALADRGLIEPTRVAKWGPWGYRLKEGLVKEVRNIPDRLAEDDLVRASLSARNLKKEQEWTPFGMRSTAPAELFAALVDDVGVRLEVFSSLEAACRVHPDKLFHGTTLAAACELVGQGASLRRDPKFRETGGPSAVLLSNARDAVDRKVGRVTLVVDPNRLVSDDQRDYKAWERAVSNSEADVAGAVEVPADAVVAVALRPQDYISKGAYAEVRESVSARPTPEMESWFDERTRKHIALVQKYARKIVKAFPSFEELLDVVQEHDAMKFEEPERTPYVFLTWQGKDPDYQYTDAIKDMGHRATLHHVRNNEHHPEHWATSFSGDSVNPDDRDAPPEPKTAPACPYGAF